MSNETHTLAIRAAHAPLSRDHAPHDLTPPIPRTLGTRPPRRHLPLVGARGHCQRCAGISHAARTFCRDRYPRRSTMNPNQALSVLVRDWMKRQKLCTRTAAKRLGMSEMSLWRRLHGHRQWRADDLLSLCYEGIRIPHEIFYALLDEENIYA
nr:MAG TPA: Regulatory protein-modification, helix-turn-helix, transcriptional regulator, DNA [Caudoviricetes sp.]